MADARSVDSKPKTAGGCAARIEPGGVIGKALEGFADLEAAADALLEAAAAWHRMTQPEPVLRILDEDELASCAAAGMVSPEERAWIAGQTDLIVTAYRRIIAEAQEYDSLMDDMKGVHSV